MTVTEHHAEYMQYNPQRPLAEQLLEWSRAGKRSGTAFAAMVQAVADLEATSLSHFEAVEANRMLTERLEAYEVREATVRRECHKASDDVKLMPDWETGCGCGDMDAGEREGYARQALDILSILDQPIGSVHTEQQEKP